MPVSPALRVRRAWRLVTLAAVLGFVTIAVAAASDVRTARGARGAGSTTIMGSAWNADNTPIPGARLQLRDVVTGKIRAAAVADPAGRFTFSNIEGGTYVVELVGVSGKIVTVGHAFVIAPGETVATFVRLGNRVPWFSGFFNNAAGAVVSTASSQGITAVAPVQLPASPTSTAKR